MFEWFEKSWVSTVASIVGAIIGIVGIILFFKSGTRGRPTSQMRSLRLIGKENQNLPENVKILFDTEEVPRLTLTKVWFWNDGTQTIHGRDIVEDDPLRLVLEDDELFLTASVSAATRTVNKFHAEIDRNSRNKCIINFDFLDPKDGARIELLHTAKSVHPKLLGTIRGLPEGVSSVNLTSSDVEKGIRNRLRKNRIPMLVVTLLSDVFPIIASLLPAPWLHPFFDDPLRDKNGVSLELPMRLGFITVGILYTALPAYVFYRTRRRYPPALESEELAPKGSSGKTEPRAI